MLLSRQKESRRRVFSLTVKAVRAGVGGAAQRPAVWRSEKATLSRLLHIAPAQHVLDSTTSRFLSQYELNLDFLSTQQESRWWYWGYIVSSWGQAIRKGICKGTINWRLLFFGDGLKIAITVLDTDLYLFISFFTYILIFKPFSVSTWSLWRGGGERRKLKSIS